MKRVPLTQGYESVVDDADYELVMAVGPWCAAVRPRNVYAARCIRCADDRWSTQLLHTFLTGWPETDHRDHDGLNNRRENLRPATRNQNNANHRLRLSSASGFKGVTWHKRAGRWRAQITSEYRNIYLGLFGSAEEAARAYDVAALAMWGDFAHLNFPREGEQGV